MNKTQLDISQWTYNWALQQESLSKNTFYFETLTSTSDQAKSEAPEDLHNQTPLKIYLTREQTQGRGRKKNTWSSPEAGSSLFLTISDSTKLLVSPTLTAKVGLGLIRALSNTFSELEWNLKAPNDIYLGNQKTAGILIENILMGQQTRILIGIGINVLSHPPEIEIATDIQSHLNLKTPHKQITQGEWFSFLTTFFKELKNIFKTLDQPLDAKECLELKDFLNKHPLLKEPYLLVLPDGSLQSATHTTHWMEL